ncbi:MAG: hypothetical protein EPN38_05670 [Rhodanobacteraceae bacterium]|nr:MAG: hypothetical protein EPN38_05670 [Rhodanobacteraceae bacterium]
MQARHWLPYRQLQTQRLGLALATARVIAWIGMLLVAAGAAYAVTAVVTRVGSGAATLALGLVVGLIAYGLAALALSGALAAVIGIEDSLRRREGHD